MSEFNQVMTEEIAARIIRPVIGDGDKFPYYGLDPETGQIWSYARKTPIAIKYNQRSPSKPETSYLAMNVYDEIFSSRAKGFKSFNVHMLIHETLNPETPKPRGMSDAMWERFEEAAKPFLRDMWFVNHIDHNRLNYHPSNLEWVSGKENAQKAADFYKAEKLRKAA